MTTSILQSAFTVNDVHSRLNQSCMERIAVVKSVEEIREAVNTARSQGLTVAVAGGRHAMGGQQFCEGGLLIDSHSLDRVLEFDKDAGTITVEAGIQWPELVAYLLDSQASAEHTDAPWTIRQKQTGADRLSIGGTVSANGHGRGLSMTPIVGDVENLTVVDAVGQTISCSRDENRELFRLIVGGYGLFGVIYSVTLRLSRRRQIERVVEVREITDIPADFQNRIDEGFLYGDFQFSIDEDDDNFLTRGVFSCYRPVDIPRPVPPDQKVLSREQWAQLLYLAHADKSKVFDLYADHYLATTGQLYYSDKHQMADYFDGYHQQLDLALEATVPATEMITEIYVPREQLPEFMQEAAHDLRSRGANVIYGTVRLIEPDHETFLAWAKRPYACIIFNLHTEHSEAGIEHSADAFRHLIDLAIKRNGSYFLTYHRYARRDQIEQCYPQFEEFLALKRTYDPGELFQSDWYQHYRSMFGHSSEIS